MELGLRYNMPEYANVPTLALKGIGPEGETESVLGALYWRWDDDPTMSPQFLGTARTGETFRGSFPNPDERNVLLFLTGLTAEGGESQTDLTNAQRLVVIPSQTPVLEALSFDSGDNENDLTIANNGGTGDINIYRSIDGEPFAIIDSVSPATTLYHDPVVLDGDYAYKLTQDGVVGESNTRTVTVSGVGGPAGSPPSGLTASYDDPTDTATLNWTNNGGTGDNIIERSLNGGGFTVIDTVASGVATYDDLAALPHPYFNRTYTYRVSNASVAGYSNEDQVFVEAEL